MSIQASDLARRLAEQTELVCRHYLSNGRRVGYYGIGKAAVCHLEVYPRDDR